MEGRPLMAFTESDRATYRDEKRAEQRQLVEASVRELLSSDGWRRFAEARATFHRYSIGNALLIAAQRPDAVQVAGFKAWQELGRQVRKGERAIRIMAPMAIKERDAAGDETGERRMLFRSVPVFDIAQTAGEPLAEIPREPLTGDSHADRIPVLEAYARSIGFSVDREDLPESCGGYCSAAQRRIVIATAHDSANAVVRTLVHELAHALGIGYAEFGREVAEVITETCTVVVCGALGLDTSGESIPYIASWAEQDLDAIKRHAEKVDQIARELEAACGLTHERAGEV
jgi:antirestriction protein ArdC